MHTEQRQQIMLETRTHSLKGPLRLLIPCVQISKLQPAQDLVAPEAHNVSPEPRGIGIDSEALAGIAGHDAACL